MLCPTLLGFTGCCLCDIPNMYCLVGKVCNINPYNMVEWCFSFLFFTLNYLH